MRRARGAHLRAGSPLVPVRLPVRGPRLREQEATAARLLDPTRLLARPQQRSLFPLVGAGEQPT